MPASRGGRRRRAAWPREADWRTRPRRASRSARTARRRGRRRHRLVDRRVQRPAALARVGDTTRVPIQGRAVDERGRGQVEQPRGDYAAAAPHLGDCGEIEVVPIVIGIAQRRGFGVRLLLGVPHVRVLEDVQPFGVRLHDPVLDPVVDHLHEVAGSARPAVQPAFSGCATSPSRPGCARRFRRRERGRRAPARAA